MRAHGIGEVDGAALLHVEPGKRTGPPGGVAFSHPCKRTVLPTDWSAVPAEPTARPSSERSYLPQASRQFQTHFCLVRPHRHIHSPSGR